MLLANIYMATAKMSKLKPTGAHLRMLKEGLTSLDLFKSKERD